MAYTVNYGVVSIMGKQYCSSGILSFNFVPSFEFLDFLRNAIKEGMSKSAVQDEVNKYMRENSEEELIFASDCERECCKKFTNVSDEVWDELLECYDMNNLDIPEKKKLANDMMDKGIISEIDRDRFINMLNQEKEKDKSPSYSSESSYSSGMYSNSGGVLKGEIHVATLGSMMSEAEKDNIFARLDFNHLIEQIKDYAYCNG